MKRYFVCIEWGFYPDGDCYDNCFISYATPENEEYNGFNIIGHGGDEGLEYFIANTLEEVLIQCKYNPGYISFDLSDEDMKLKDQILNKYMWDKEKGLVKKEVN